MDVKAFDIIEYLKDREIEYHEGGEENVSQGWIGIQCPFPGCTDELWHCGINLENKAVNCWVCGSTGSIISLVREIEECSWKEANKIISTFSSEDVSEGKKLYDQKREKTSKTICSLPKEATGIFPESHIQYLKRRRFDPYFLIDKYKLKACYNLGKYKFRIIAPVFLDGKLVSFIGRDVTGKAHIPYKNCPVEESIISVKNTLYNIDSVKHSAIIVEGITDVWRIGDGCIATLGEQFTTRQLSLLVKKNIKRALVLYDSDALRMAHKLSIQLSGVIGHVEKITLPYGDPADLNEKNVREIKEFILEGE